MTDKKPTIYDLADALGVSVGTVYRALHNTGRISKVTKARILEKAEEMNFTLNRSAQGLSRAPITIGVILCCPVIPFLDEIRSGIDYEFSSLSQYNVFSDVRIMPPQNAEDCSEQISQCLLEFVERSYGGIVLFLSGSHEKCDPALRAVEKAKIPMVCITNDIPYENRVVFVTADGYCAGRISAELLALTCPDQRIAILTGDSSIHIHRQNLEGFMKEAANSTFAATDIYEHQDQPERVEQRLMEIFQHQPTYQGLYITSASSITACPLLMDMNRNRALKVITTDLFQQITQPLDEGIITATIFQNPFLQGRKSVTSLYRHLHNEEVSPVIKIPPQIVMRSNVDLYHINNTNHIEPMVESD